MRIQSESAGISAGVWVLIVLCGDVLFFIFSLIEPCSILFVCSRISRLRSWRTKKGTLAELSTLGVRDTPHIIGNNIKENAAKIAVIPFFTKHKSAFAEYPLYALV